jgi:TPR repeat protein
MMDMMKMTSKRILLVSLLAGALGQPALAQDTLAPVPAARVTAIAGTTPITFKPFRRGITATVQLPASLQIVRRNLIAGKRLRTADLRALADAGDSLAQMRFAKQLSEMSDPSLLRAQVHYYAMAAYNGREGAVRPLLSLLRSQGASFDSSVLANAEAALLAQASHGQIDAIEGMAKFYLAGAPFGAKQVEGQEMLTRVARAGDAQAALDLALQMIAERQGTGLQDAREFLEIAASSNDLAVKATATSLLNSGGEI